MKLFSCFITLSLLCLLSDSSFAARKNREKRWTFDIRTAFFMVPKAIEIIKDIANLWEVLLKEPDSSIGTIIFRHKQENIIRQFLEVKKKLSVLEQDVGNVADTTITSILDSFPKMIKLELLLHDLTQIINQINFADEQMQDYFISLQRNDTMNSGTDSNWNSNLNADIDPSEEMSNAISKRETRRPRRITEKLTLLDFATSNTGHSFNSLSSNLRRMNDMVTAQETNLFVLVKEVSQDVKTNVCNLKQSPYQTIYNLYNAIAVAELKGNAILQFSYMLLRTYNQGNFTTEAKLALQAYEKLSKEKLRIVRDVLSDTDRSVYKCDPKQYVEGVSFTKLTKLLQGYIENEVNLNPQGGCWENCQYYQYTEYNGCYKAQFCAHQPQCSGKVINCRFVDSDMDICTSSDPERRYDWIQYENGKTLGNKGVCQRKNFYKVDSWWRYLFWHCSYCFCLCDDGSQHSHRYFNLRDVTSDIEKNKVVTGIRIVKQNKIIHLQIQQGDLTPLGVVNKTSLSWKPVENYTIDDDNVENNVDYHTMSWLERAIDTDEVFGPPEHVVTGVRFRKIGTHLNLEIRVTPINFTTGEVFQAHHSYWLGNDNTEANPSNPRTEIILNNPDIPIRKGPHLLNSKHDQYIQFQATSYETDAAQSTVPYLDSQALTSEGFILSGIGLIHRGRSGSGGFIAPKLISYDIVPHLRFSKTE